MTIRYRLRGKAGARLSQPGQVAAAVRKIVGDDPREHFVVVHLDSRHQVMDVEVAHIGTLNQSLVHPREVFRSAIVRSDAAIVVAHQHPSGDPRPSVEDYSVTERLVKAGEILGVRVLDHVVVGGSSWVSIREARPELFV
jgi:DNA repair protein RadC